jgi:hypothetical protein
MLKSKKKKKNIVYPSLSAAMKNQKQRYELCK